MVHSFVIGCYKGKIGIFLQHYFNLTALKILGTLSIKTTNIHNVEQEINKGNSGLKYSQLMNLIRLTAGN